MVLKVAEEADMMDFALFVEAGNRFGSGLFPSGGVNEFDWEVRIYHSECVTDHLSALIGFGDDPGGCCSTRFPLLLPEL